MARADTQAAASTAALDSRSRMEKKMEAAIKMPAAFQGWTLSALRFREPDPSIPYYQKYHLIVRLIRCFI
jgi:hypothetical protein